MGSDAEKDYRSSTPKLPLFSISHSHIHMQSPERPGTLTPPLHSSAAVPFRWEEEPGKPKPCTALNTFSSPNEDFSEKCLELPPRLLAKLSSPTTVLDGPYIGKSCRFQSYSFRHKGGECYGSFRTGTDSPESIVSFGSMVLSRTSGHNEKGLLGSWKRRALKGNIENGGGSYVFPSLVDKEGEDRSISTSGTSVKITTIRRAGSFSSLPHGKPRFWASIYEGLKQAVPWRGKKTKRMGL